MRASRLSLISWLFLLIFAPSAAGELFQWTDPQGTIHFTDSFLSVPASARMSSDFTIRRDWGTTELSVQSLPEPAPNLPVPETPRPPEARSDQITQLIHYNPQQITIVQVTNIVRRREPKPTPIPAAKRSFDDRRFIHPSVFGGGPQQYIHPEVLSSSRR